MELLQNLFKKDKNKSKDKKDLTKNQFLTEPTPYRFTPSFIKHNGMYAAIVKLYIKQGTNRNMSYNDILDFVPTSTITGVDIHFMVDDVLVKDDEKNKIITNNSSVNLAIIKDDDRTAKKKQESGKIEETQDKKILRESEQADYLAYQSIIGNSEPVAVYRWSLLVIGESMELVDEQIKQLNTRLAKSHDGAVWDSLPGEQAQLFENLFGVIEKDRFNHTTWGSNYAGLNVSMRLGKTYIHHHVLPHSSTLNVGHNHKQSFQCRKMQHYQCIIEKMKKIKSQQVRLLLKPQRITS